MNFNIFKRKKKTPETRCTENHIRRLRKLSRPLQILLDENIPFEQTESAIHRIAIVDLAHGLKKSDCSFCYIYGHKFRFYNTDGEKKFFKLTLHDFLSHFETMHKNLTTEANQK